MLEEFFPRRGSSYCGSSALGYRQLFNSSQQVALYRDSGSPINWPSSSLRFPRDVSECARSGVGWNGEGEDGMMGGKGRSSRGKEGKGQQRG